MVQTRRLMHMTMPGYADLWEVDKFFHNSIAIDLAKRFPSASEIRNAGIRGIAQALHRDKIRFQERTIEKIVAWSATAAEPSELAQMQTRQWQQYDQMRLMIGRQIDEAEREMAGFLVKTPWILLLSVCGINVVSAARLAGEAGPIERYASARALNGRAGLYPSRYQSDQVDYCNGPLVRQCNRKLRGAAMLVAENLIKCHPYYRNLSESWKARAVDPRERRCRVANRAMRMVYQLVAGRHVWRGKGVDREYLLDKLRQFHLDHHSDVGQTIADLHEAFNWLPGYAYADEARPLQQVTQKRSRKVQSVGELLIPLLIKLGVGRDEKNEPQTTGGAAPERVESSMSEARSSK
ncbi:MAG: transposase [Pirellulaceae bacterium]